jgi:hypothetical protein
MKENKATTKARIATRRLRLRQETIKELAKK